MRLHRCVAVCLTVAAVPVWAADTYVSDPAHTQVSFEIGHLGISRLRGRFNKVSAKIVLDHADRKGSIEAAIDAASVDIGLEARDKLVRSPDYLDTGKFPVITFKSHDLKFDGDNLVAAEGDLTLAGVTRPVTLAIPAFRCIQHPVNKRDMCGAEATTVIKRSEWGLTRGSSSVGDEIRISINIEAMKQ